MTSLPNAVSTTLDRQAARLLADLAGLPPANLDDLQQVRKSYLLSWLPLLWTHDPIGETETFVKEGMAPAMVLYRPAEPPGQEPLQTFAFLRGGGWTVGGLATYESLCRRLCYVLRANILFVDYRLAPQHPFPAPLMDAEHAVRWLFANAFRLGISQALIGIMGDSAGTNLAAVLAIKNRDGLLGGKSTPKC